MKKLLEAKRARLSELKALIGTLSAKDSLNEDETKSLSESLTEAKTLQGEVEAIAKQVEEIKGLEDFMAKPILDLPTGTKEASQQKDGAFNWEGKAGTEVVSKYAGEDGKQRLIMDAEGWAISPKQMAAISEPAYKQAWLNCFVRKGNNFGDAADMKALSEGLDSGGGYLVPPDIANKIIIRKPQPTHILGQVNVMTTSRDRVIIPKFKYTTDDKYSTGLRIAWSGETGTAGEDTSLEKWGAVEIPVYTGAFVVKASRDLIEDAAFDVEAFISEQGRSSYEIGMDDIVINGSGIGRPKGILWSPGAADEPPTVNIGNAVTADGLTSLVYGLPPQYQDNAIAVMNRTDVFKTFAKIKDTANNYIFGLTTNIAGGLATAREPILLGYPIIFSSNMPNGAGAANVVSFGDHREGYTLVQRVGLTVEPLLDANLQVANQRGWYFRFRSGGAVTQDRAINIGVQS